MQAREPLWGLAAWQAQIEACRADPPEAEESHWQRVAAWYDHWVRSNDYVQQVWPRLEQLVCLDARVLEIGPGTGAFTLPLASAARQVVAIEPSDGMRQVLQQRLAEQGLGNVFLMEQRIEEAIHDLDGAFDLALASHSLYNVLEIQDVLRYLLAHARRSVILMGTGYQQEWLRQIYRRFRGKEPVSPAHYGQFAQVLEEMGIPAQSEIMQTSSNYSFDSADGLLKWWAPRISTDWKNEPELRQALLTQAEWRDGAIGIYGHQRVALIQIEGEPQGAPDPG